MESDVHMKGKVYAVTFKYWLYSYIMFCYKNANSGIIHI